MNKNNFTFEQLCIRHEKGYSFDMGTMFIPSDPNSFDDVVFKLISKIDTSMLLLKTHQVEVENFTIIAIPLSSQETSEQHHSDIRTYQGRKSKLQMPKSSNINLNTLQNAWDYLSEEGWHGLQSLALLSPDSIPDTGSRKYSLYQFTTCIMDVIRANYMFQKFKSNFHHETLEMFDETDIKGATQAVFGLLWKGSSTLKEKRIFITPSLKRKSNIIPGLEISSSPQKKYVSPVQLSPRFSKRQTQKELEQMHVTFEDANDDDDDDDDNNGMEIDEEISFKNPGLPMQPEKFVPVITEFRTITEDKPQTTSGPKGRRKTLKRDPSPTPTPSFQQLPLVADIPLGFEIGSANVSKGPRKSMGRKSLSSDWPEEERINILDVFDNLNPNVSEQKRIALTCKYVSLLMEKELPSKLLYQWIQKKGRVIHRTATTFSIPEGDEQKEVALKCYRELNENCSETARVAFALKYLDVQYGLSINSKQLYIWLNEKPAAVRKQAKKR